MKQKSWVSIIFSIAAQCKGKIIMSVICAIISVVSGVVPYWSVYQIITIFINGPVLMAELKWCFVGVGLMCFALYSMEFQQVCPIFLHIQFSKTFVFLSLSIL